MTESCQTCRYWLAPKVPEGEDATKHAGYCRKNPPVVLTGDKGISSSFPPIMAHGWCGEWSDKDASPEADFSAWCEQGMAHGWSWTSATPRKPIG